MDDCKMDFSAGKNELTGKANALLMRAKGKLVCINKKAILESGAIPKHTYVKSWI